MSTIVITRNREIERAITGALPHIELEALLHNVWPDNQTLVFSR
ncbi:MAG TPA: hypothetical protein VI479_13345 [Blastocatellia bacterium]